MSKNPNIYYLDIDTKEERGPLTDTEFRDAFFSGKIDGLTLVKDGKIQEWKPLTESSLRDFITTSANEDAEDDEKEQIKTVSTTNNTEAVKTNITEHAQYFYATNNTSYSTIPVSITDLQQLLLEGKITTSTLIWTPGQEQWQSYATIFPDILPTSDAKRVSIKKQEDTQQEMTGKKRNRDTNSKQGYHTKSNKQALQESSNFWIKITNLPSDIQQAEIKSLITKAGIVAIDTLTGKEKIFIEKSKVVDTSIAYVCFLKSASVSLALTLVDGIKIRNTHIVHVEQTIPPKYIHSKIDLSKLSEKERNHILALEATQKAQLSWSEDGDDDSFAWKTIILRNVFDPEDILSGKEDDDDLAQDVASEAVKFGEVRNLHLYSKKGCITIEYTSPSAATDALNAFNGRFFGGRTLQVEFYDGLELEEQIQDTAIEESKAEEEKRLKEYSDWLEQEV